MEIAHRRLILSWALHDALELKNTNQPLFDAAFDFATLASLQAEMERRGVAIDPLLRLSPSKREITTTPASEDSHKAVPASVLAGRAP
jgi:hypothetical protein